MKCHLMKPINYNKWTINQIVTQLSIVQQMSLGFRCREDMNPSSTANRNYFTNEYTELTTTILKLQPPNSLKINKLNKIKAEFINN